MRQGRIPELSGTLGNPWKFSTGVPIYRFTLIEVWGPFILTPSSSAHLCRWWRRRMSIRRHFLQWREVPLILRIIFNQFHNASWSLHLSLRDYNSVLLSGNETCDFYPERYREDLHTFSRTLRRKTPSVNFIFRCWNLQFAILSLRYFPTIKKEQRSSLTRTKHFILSSTSPRTKSIVEVPRVRAIQCPAQLLYGEQKLFIATRNFVDFLVASSMFPTGSDWQQQHPMAKRK